MIGASKILTVSYGTFSCTLEGFDDPFNTMKAIAEYFRDLAAEDRYFGAEPPTPDAAMLHRIAEREVQRRVDASVQDNGVILRAHNDSPPTYVQPPYVERAAAEPTALVAPIVEPLVVEPPAAVIPAAVIPAPAQPPEIITAPHVAFAEVAPEPKTAIVAAQPVLSDMPEGVAARLAKIRAAVALTEVAAPVAALSEYVEDQHADEAFAAFDSVEDPVVPMISDVSYLASDDADDEPAASADAVYDDAFVDAADIAEREVLDQPALRTPSEDFSPEFLAELAEDQLDTAAEVEVDEREEDLRAALTADETPALIAGADHLLPEDYEDLAEAPVETTAFAAAPDTSSDNASDSDSDSDADILLALAQDTPALSLPDAPADLASPDDDAMLADISEAMADAPAPLQNADTIIFNDDEDLLPEAVFAADEPDADDALPDDEFAALDDDLPAAALDADAPTVVAAAADDIAATELPATEESATEEPVAEDPVIAEPQATEPVSDKAQRARARVIRVRRNPDIALARSEPEPTADRETETETSAEDAAQAALSAEAEAELQRELAALEDATMEAEAFDAALRAQLSSIAASADPETPPSPAGTLDPTVQDESLRRLMDQTQTEMAEPANRRRLSSIAHLKAAVAATIAERFGSKPKPAEEVEAVRTEPYRNDLARAVRPARPTSSNTGQTERPIERPTPLVLVSEQRIDRPAPTAAPGPVTPVRPRRVSAQAVAVQQAFDDDDLDLDAGDEDDSDNIFGDAKGFSDFADRMGATDLPDLLEAAAAYSAAVEGRANFTRPQLLRQIAAVTGTDVSREDELRGFGVLLRNGRIVKVKRGQFALTESSSYLGEARKIGG